MHVNHLLIDDETMSKSKGNIFTLPEIVARGHHPAAIRYLLLSAHYRSKLSFTWEGLRQAGAALERVHGFVKRLAEVEAPGPASSEAVALAERSERAFDAALADDLNTPEALAAVHGLVGEGNALLASGKLTREGAALLLQAVTAMDAVLGVLVPETPERLTDAEQALFDARQEARRKREFAKADEMRRQLEELGILLEDTPKGTRWRRRR